MAFLPGDDSRRKISACHRLLFSSCALSISIRTLRAVVPAAKTIAAKPIQKKSVPTNLDLTFLKPLKVDGQIKIGVLKSAGTTARNVRIEMESAQLEKSKR